MFTVADRTFLGQRRSRVMMILRSASVSLTLSVAPIHCEPMNGAGVSALVIVAVKSRRRKKRRRMVGGFVFFLLGSLDMSEE